MKSSIHIGLNGVDAPSYGGWPGELNGPVVDCSLLAPQFAQAGFEARSILNEAATRRGVADAMTSLASVSRPGDTVFIQYSGHGARQNLGWLGGQHESLCLYDGHLYDADLRRLLARFQAGVRVILFLDCCHSGGMSRSGGAGQLRQRVSPVWLPRVLPPEIKAVDEPVTAAVIIATACRPEETCTEDYVPELNRVLGAFTHAASASLSPGLTWAQWLDQTRSFALDHYPTQHPCRFQLGVGAADLLQSHMSDI